MQHLRTKLDALLLDELEERADDLVGLHRAGSPKQEIMRFMTTRESEEGAQESEDGAQEQDESDSDELQANDSSRGMGIIDEAVQGPARIASHAEALAHVAEVKAERAAMIARMRETHRQSVETAASACKPLTLSTAEEKWYSKTWQDANPLRWVSMCTFCTEVCACESKSDPSSCHAFNPTCTQKTNADCYADVGKKKGTFELEMKHQWAQQVCALASYAVPADQCKRAGARCTPIRPSLLFRPPIFPPSRSPLPHLSLHPTPVPSSSPSPLWYSLVLCKCGST